MLAYHFWIQYKLRYRSFVSGAVSCVIYSAVYHRLNSFSHKSVGVLLKPKIFSHFCAYLWQHYQLEQWFPNLFEPLPKSR